jgi:hypothetical protein
MIEMVVRIIPAGVMPDPLAIRMDVGGVWVPSLVAVIAVFLRGMWLPANGSRAVSRRSVDGGALMLALPTSSLREKRH